MSAMEPNYCIIPVPVNHTPAVCGDPGVPAKAVRGCGHTAYSGVRYVCPSHLGDPAPVATICPTCGVGYGVRFVAADLDPVPSTWQQWVDYRQSLGQ